MTPSRALVALIALAALAAAPAWPAGTRERPLSFLVILVDDLRPELGAYENEQASSPAIDALARSGTVFWTHFAQSPVCGASRASLLTGVRPTPRRFLSYDSRIDEDAPERIPLQRLLAEHGYASLSRGKVLHMEADSRDSWSEPPWNPEGGWQSPAGRNAARDDLQKAYAEPSSGRGPLYERAEVDDNSYPDGELAARVVADLAGLAKSEQPFFLAVGFRKPHLPFTAPAPYWERHQRSGLRLPPTYQAAPRNVPARALHRWLEVRQYAGAPAVFGFADGDALTMIHAYHAAVSYVDAQIGRVLDGLEATGLASSTAVLLLGDHGWNLGEHTLWAKHSLFDITLRSPLIVRVPGMPAGGSVRGITEHLDLYPTIVSLAGIAPPEGLEGQSLGPLLRDPRSPGKPASRSRWLDGESLRTERFRYTAWRSSSGERTDEMLFDLDHDPAETVNVAANPVYAEAVAALRIQLDIPGAVPTWSPELRRLSRLWRLSNSTPALVAIAYPRSSLLAILAVSIGAGVLLFRRSRRLRAPR